MSSTITAATHVVEAKVSKAINTVMKKWTIQISLILLRRGRARFTDLMKELHPISPKALADRLKEMEKLRLIERRAFPEIPPRVEYSLTDKGSELAKATKTVRAWASRWASREIKKD